MDSEDSCHAFDHNCKDSQWIMAMRTSGNYGFDEDEVP